jgi:putative FmdB family regulatory protein
MPTYEYKCLSCGHDFEMFQKMMDEPLKKCPKCNGEVKRLLGAGAGPIFKGSGFYHTDYKNSKTESKAEKPKPASSKDKDKS